eukprot:1193010-Prorocentrum_minimum.AAC.1
MSPAPKMSNAHKTSKQGPGVLESSSTAMARGSSKKSPPSGSVFTPRRSPRFAFSNTPPLSVDQSAQSLGTRKSATPFRQGLRSEGSEGIQKPDTRRKANVVRRSGQRDATHQTPSWDRITEIMTSLSTVPFLFLQMPQVWKNALQLMAGNYAALAIISWAVSFLLLTMLGSLGCWCSFRVDAFDSIQPSAGTLIAFERRHALIKSNDWLSCAPQGYTSGMLGNLLLFSYFASKGERSASFVQGIGVLSTATLLVQTVVRTLFVVERLVLESPRSGSENACPTPPCGVHSSHCYSRHGMWRAQASRPSGRPRMESLASCPGARWVGHAASNTLDDFGSRRYLRHACSDGSDAGGFLRRTGTHPPPILLCTSAQIPRSYVFTCIILAPPAHLALNAALVRNVLVHVSRSAVRATFTPVSNMLSSPQCSLPPSPRAGAHFRKPYVYGGVHMSSRCFPTRTRRWASRRHSPGSARTSACTHARVAPSLTLSLVVSAPSGGVRASSREAAGAEGDGVCVDGDAPLHAHAPPAAGA